MGGSSGPSRPQGAGQGPLAHMLPRGPFSAFPGLCPLRPPPPSGLETGRMRAASSVRVLEAGLPPMKPSIHLGTAPLRNTFLRGFYPSEDGKCLQ